MWSAQEEHESKIDHSNVIWGQRVIGVSRFLIPSKTLMELIFNPCVEFRWSLEGPVSQIHTPHLHVGAPEYFSDLLKSVQILKREWGAESNGELLHISIPSKTAALVPEYVVEDLPLGRTAALVPEFAVKDLPLVRTLLMIYHIILYCIALYYIFYEVSAFEEVP